MEICMLLAAVLPWPGLTVRLATTAHGHEGYHDAAVKSPPLTTAQLPRSRQCRAEGEALHKAGKHQQSVERLGKGMQILGIHCKAHAGANPNRPVSAPAHVYVCVSAEGTGMAVDLPERGCCSLGGRGVRVESILPA